MSGHIDETFELVLRFKDNRNSTVRRTVIELLPRVAMALSGGSGRLAR